MRLWPAVTVAIALAFCGPARAQSADEKLKALIGGKKKQRAERAPTSSSLGSGKDDEPGPAPVADAPAVAACTQAELSLLRALQSAFEPAPREIRVIAVEDLALLQDPRALNALAHGADPAVAQAAVRTVGHFQHPRAEEILANVVRHPQLSEKLKVAAVTALPVQGTASARELLGEVAKAGKYPGPVITAAKEALQLTAAKRE